MPALVAHDAMSSQLRFDAEGLRRAIEHGDPRYHAALYAADAEVRIADADTPDLAPEVLRGHAAISEWVQDLSDSSDGRWVLDLEATADRMVLVEELRLLDGTRVAQRSSARLQGGQIVDESVTRDRRTAAGLDLPAAGLRVDAAPEAPPRPRTGAVHPASTPGTARDLPGQYFG